MTNIDGLKEGTAILYSSKKTKLAKLEYRKDKLHGLCIFYDKEGHKIKEALYDNDVHSGWGCEYENYEVIFYGIYKDGVRYSELRKCKENASLLEEVRNNQVLSVSKYTDDFKKHGLCYHYENGILRECIYYDNGNKNELKYKFIDNIMIEYDESGKVIYKGSYEGSPYLGISRGNNGRLFTYSDKGLKEIIFVENGQRKKTITIDKEVMKEYYEECLFIKETLI